MTDTSRKAALDFHMGIMLENELQPGYRESLDQLLRASTCPACPAALQAVLHGQHVSARCTLGHEVALEELLDIWSKSRSPSLGRLLRILSLNEAWCRGMAGKALQMGLASLAADYHERATSSGASANLIRETLHRDTPDE